MYPYEPPSRSVECTLSRHDNYNILDSLGLPSSPMPAGRPRFGPASRSPRRDRVFWKRACCRRSSPTADSVLAPAVSGTQLLLPALVAADDAIYVPAAVPASKTLAPATLVVALDSVFLPTVERLKLPKETRLRPGLRIDDSALEVFFPFIHAAGPVSMQPGLVPNDDAVAASDVGWHLYGDEVVADVDTFHTDIDIDTIAFVLPEVLGDEESVDTYPFRLQALTGGVPVPAKPHLIGSFPRRTVLRGSIASRVHLRGSIAPRIAGNKR